MNKRMITAIGLIAGATVLVSFIYKLILFPKIDMRLLIFPIALAAAAFFVNRAKKKTKIDNFEE